MKVVIRLSLAVLSLIFIIIIINFFAKANDKFVETPQVEDHQVAPRIIYIENPRFPKLEQSDLRVILKSAKVLLKDHFNINMIFPEKIQVRNIKDEFEKLITNEPKGFRLLIGDFRNNDVDWEIVRKNLIQRIQSDNLSLHKQIEFSRSYLIQPLEVNDIDSFSRAIIDTFKTRLSYWSSATSEDGYPVIGKNPYLPDMPFNEYVYWALMAREGINGDVILTNQLVASVEYAQTPIHTAIRGGITGGSTDYNPSSKYGSSVWISLFPYLSNDEEIKKLRNGDTYTRHEALAYAGAMLAHEMGHQLFHLKHPWSNTNCIMRPAEMLDFAKWVKNLDPSKCKLNSSIETIPGAIRLPIW